jgi:light-regulated signal transduction histidine kinase (bacteriophytochrome)
MNVNDNIQNSKILEAEALNNCNSEPIQTPGYIQSHGALLVFHVHSLCITYASKNITDYFDLDFEKLFDLSARAVFNREDFHDLSNVASRKAAFQQSLQVKTITCHGAPIDLSLFRVGDHVVVELIPQYNSSSSKLINSHLKWVLDTINALDDVQDILEQTLSILKSVTQFDRLKAYMFHPDNSGEVVAELNNGKMDSLLGLHFPASDIPPIARQIYSKIAIRHIRNSNDNGTELIAAPQLKSTPLNIALALLRGNSPIHNQYLRNMGVASTLSLPIMIKGKLWGLFALHHKTIVNLSTETLRTAELIGQLASIVLTQKIQQNAEQQLNKLYLEEDELITLNQNKFYLQKFWNTNAVKLKALINCHGVSYQIDDHILVHGSCPSRKAIVSIAKTVLQQDTNIFHTAKLTTISQEDCGNSKGVLSLCVHRDAPKVIIYFFRDALTKAITWAGNPQKDLEFTKEGVRLHPRSSFNTFKATSKEQSKLWNSETLHLAEMAMVAFKKAIAVEKATTARLNTVVKELNHRLRNILTLVRSISKQTDNNGITVKDYIYILEQRILTLAKANDLLTASFYNAIDITSIFKTIILSLYDRPEQLSLEGPDTKISSEITSLIVLITHELTTNAIKYGAFSTPKGRIAIKWYHEKEGLNIEWKETDGPAVSPPKKIGFGTNIIENAIKYEFDGASKMHFLKEGLLVKLIIPRNLIDNKKNHKFVLDQVKEMPSIKSKKKATHLNVLILEDDFITAQDLQHAIAKLAVKNIDMFSNQKEAFQALNTNTYHLALLDVNLKKETSLHIAKYCKLHQIPFYYITGYGNSFIEGSNFPEAPILLKPTSTEQVINIVTHHILNTSHES